MKPDNHKGFTRDDIEVAVKWIKDLGIWVDKTCKPSFTYYGEGDGYIDISIKSTANAAYRILKKNPELKLDSDWARSWHWTTARFALADGRPGYIVISFDSALHATARNVTLIRIFSHVPNGRHMM